MPLNDDGMKTVAVKVYTPSPRCEAKIPWRPAVNSVPSGRLIWIQRPDGVTGGSMTVTLPGGPSTFAVPTACACAGSWPAGVASKFERKSVSEVQPVNASNAAAAATLRMHSRTSDLPKYGPRVLQRRSRAIHLIPRSIADGRVSPIAHRSTPICIAVHRARGTYVGHRYAHSARDARCVIHCT